MITGDNDMENTNLEALNALIEKIRAGEGTAESNLEALNMLCVLSGGTGKAKSNLEALNELLTVFEAAKPEQVKSVAITENGTTKVSPDDGYVLSSVNVDVNVPSKPEQAKSVTITENGTTEITPDEGYTLSGASVSVNVSSGSDYNVKASVIYTSQGNTQPVGSNATEIDLSNATWNSSSTKNLDGMFYYMQHLNKVIWGDIIQKLTSDSVSCSRLFYQCSNMKLIDLSAFGSKIITNPGDMFSHCTKLTSVLWGDVKVQTTNFSYMFNSCEKLETVDTSFLDPNYHDTNSIACMFSHCYILKSVDLSNLYTANITNTVNTFASCRRLTEITFENGCFSNASMTALYLNACPLTHDCAVDIFNKLATRDNSPSLKLSTTTKGYLTDDEIAIATGKGWVVS